MPLQLVPVLIHTAEEISATVHVQHDALAFFVLFFSLIIVAAHFYPFCFQFGVLSPPLPPQLAANSVNSFVAQLGDESVCSARKLCLRYLDILCSDPAGRRHPLSGESL